MACKHIFLAPATAQEGYRPCREHVKQKILAPETERPGINQCRWHIKLKYLAPATARGPQGQIIEPQISLTTAIQANVASWVGAKG